MILRWFFIKFCDKSTFLKKTLKMFLKRCAHARGNSWKKKIEAIFLPYMHPIYALSTPYMHPIWRTYLARARARAPGPRRRGASGPYPQKRVKLFPHARAPANRVPKSISLFDDACIKGFFFLSLEAKGGLIHSFLEKMYDFMHFFKKITGWRLLLPLV